MTPLNKTLAACALLTFSTFAYAEAETPRAVAIAALESHDCRLTKSELRAAFREADIDTRLIKSTVSGLFNDGTLKFERKGERIVLQTGNTCSSVEVETEVINPLVRWAIVRAYQKNDCQLRLDGDEMRSLEKRYSKDSYEAAMQQLINTNAIIFSGGAEHMSDLTIGSVCGPKAE